MKRITASARIVDIFSSEPLDVCESLLDVSQSVMKQRRGTPAKKARRGKSPAATVDVRPIRIIDSETPTALTRGDL